MHRMCFPSAAGAVLRVARTVSLWSGTVRTQSNDLSRAPDRAPKRNAVEE